MTMYDIEEDARAVLKRLDDLIKLKNHESAARSEAQNLQSALDLQQYFPDRNHRKGLEKQLRKAKKFVDSIRTP